MPEDEPFESYVAPEIFVDGFTKHVARDGVMSCVGYRKSPEGRVTVIKLVWPVVNTNEAIDNANAAMNAPDRPGQGGPAGTGSKRGVH